MIKNFDKWFSRFDDSIANWTYYTDFKKVYRNTESIKNELNLLNGLIGSNDIEKEFRKLYDEYPKVLKVIPILIAKRIKEDVIVKTVSRKFYFNFKNPNYSIDEYIMFMRKSGIFDLFEKHLISNVYDYVLGVETGMDTNARKNRTGDAMEDLVEDYIIKSGYVKDVNYFKEMDTKALKNKFHIDIKEILEKIDKEINNSNEKLANKRFDFVIKGKQYIYLIEANFYHNHGSKLNETSRSYKMLFSELKAVEGIKFIWITDGAGWKKSRHNLEETYNVMDTLYNINDLDSGVLERL